VFRVSNNRLFHNFPFQKAKPTPKRKRASHPGKPAKKVKMSSGAEEDFDDISEPPTDDNSDDEVCVCTAPVDQVH
jgi:hypothetical protein